MINVQVIPSYRDSFTITWDVDNDPEIEKPFEFLIYQAESSIGELTLKATLSDEYLYESDARLLSKQLIPHFKVTLRSSNDRIVSSSVVSPYDLIPRREYLIGAEVIRKEKLNAENFGGVDLKIYYKSVYADPCPHCRDKITGSITNADCIYCEGTGNIPPYYGPVSSKGIFSKKINTSDFNQSLNGLTQHGGFQVRLAGVPELKTKDVLYSEEVGRIYEVVAAQSLAEIRRVPLILNVAVEEIVKPKLKDYFRCDEES